MSDKLIKILAVAALLLPAGGCRKQEPLVVAEDPIEDVQVTSKPAAPRAEDNATAEFANMVPYGLPSNQEVFVESRMSRIMDKIDHGDSFVVYVGHDECPFCTHAVPVLYQTAQEMEATIEYVNLLDDYSWRTEDQTESYDRFVELVGDNMRTDENGDMQFYIPFVVYVRNGTIADAHVSTVDSDDAEAEFTDEQKGELKQIYYSGFIRAGL